jgi:antitoxin CptB
MHDDLHMRRKRAAYRASHRGTKEMDIVLGRYALARLETMPEVDLEAFERFLTLPDPVLTQWFAQGEAADAGEFLQLVVALRVHHGLSPLGGSERLETR